MQTNVHLSLLYLGSCALSLLNWSAVMQVHCGSLDRLGEVGVDSGFLLTFVLCLFDVSNFNEYDEEDFRDNFTVGVCNRVTRLLSISFTLFRFYYFSCYLRNIL